MASGVGLCVGATECMAAIVSFGRDPVYVHRNSVLHLSFDGSALLGGLAPVGYDESVVDFTPFVGSFGEETGTGITVLERQRPEELLAKALACLIDLAGNDIVGTAEYYATYPAEWTSARVGRLRAALGALDRSNLTLIPSADVGTPRIAALEAALLAHTAVLGKVENPTPPRGNEAMTAPVGALAYSAMLVPLPELPAEVEIKQVAPVESPRPSRRRAVVLVSAAVVLLALAGVIAVVELRGGTGHSADQGTATASSAPVTFTVTSLVPAMPSAAMPVVAPVLPPTTARPPATGQQIATVAPVAPVALSATQSRQTTTTVAKPSLSATPTTTTATVTVTTTPTTTSASGPDIGPFPPLLGPGQSTQSQLLTTPAPWGASSDPAGPQQAGPGYAGPDGQFYSGPQVPYGRYQPQ